MSPANDRAPDDTVLRNGRDVDPTRARVRLVFTEDVDDFIPPGRITNRDLDDMVLVVGHVLFPEGEDAIPGVPILRRDDGQQVAQLVFAELVRDDDDNLGIDANGLPVYKFFTQAVDKTGYAWDAKHFAVGEEYVFKVEILDATLITHAKGDGGLRDLYLAVTQDHMNTDFGCFGF
jgi:hypothetical protein